MRRPAAGSNLSFPQFRPGRRRSREWCRWAGDGVDGCRRIFLDAGLEKITSDLTIDFIGPYQPTTFKFNGEVKGVKPAGLAGFESPIMPKGK